jgi:hypothetical protein
LPAGYAVMGQRHGVPPLILYGVALQESKLLFGPHALPWPWTLNVRGAGLRYGSYPAAVAALRSCLAAGITRVDAGLMQVNWGYHSDKLQDPARALDPYPNLAVGANILRGHFDAAGDWYSAVGRYHAPADPARAARYAAQVFRRIAQVPPSSPSPASEGAHG